MKFKILNGLRWLFVILFFVVAFGLLFNHQIATWVINHQSAKVETVAENQAHGHYAFRKVRALNTQDILLAQTKAKHFIGVVAIPAINLNVPISAGVDNVTLAQGAGTLRPHQQMGVGNYALAGHNMHEGSQILFGPLPTSAKPGQLIYVSNLKTVYVYRTVLTQYIAASDVQVIADTSKNLVTLITCNNDGSARFEVRGELVKQQSFQSTDKHLQSLLKAHVTD